MNKPPAIKRPAPQLSVIETPALLVDMRLFDANTRRLRDRLAGAGKRVQCRPHMKTVKSLALGRRMTDLLETSAITVSTLKEAQEYGAAGYRDILYAVGIAPAKLPRVAALRASGIDLTIVTDNTQAASAIAAFSAEHSVCLPTLIEIDCDGARAGVQPGDKDALIAIASALAPRDCLAGLMTHCGGSYASEDEAAIKDHAAREVAAVNEASRTLEAAGFTLPVRSIGSTPTAFYPAGHEGITEIRAGVFSFMDLVMAGIGVCEPRDIALSVLASVIGHQPSRGAVLVDAGWMAMSRDRGTAGQRIDQYYGLVCDESGTVLTDLVMISANQEHGILAMRPGSEHTLPALDIGTKLRILPNHACATAAQHQTYHCIEEDGAITRADRFSGW